MRRSASRSIEDRALSSPPCRRGIVTELEKPSSRDLVGEGGSTSILESFAKNPLSRDAASTRRVSSPRGRAIGRARRVRERDVLLGMLPFRRDSSEGKPSICTEGVEGRYAVRLLAIVAGDADATGEGERREVVAAGASGQKK